MSASTYFILPLGVRQGRVMQVICKLLGTPHEMRVLEPRRFQDFSQPCSQENSWYIRFEPRPRAELLEWDHDGGSGYFHFEDAFGHDYSWMYTSDDEHERGFIVFPDSDASAVAVGKRLVEFFGGQLHYNGSNEKTLGDYYVPPHKALFGPKGDTQSSDERYNQFQNALRTLPALTPQEILDAVPHSAYGMTEPSKKLYDALQSEVQSQQLLTQTPRASGKRKQARM